MPTNQTPGQADSARKIANYTQSISSGVTNLLTELGRVSVTTSPSSTDPNNAILLQLQIITTQIAAVNTRLDGMERTIQNLEKKSSGSIPIELSISYDSREPPTADGYNILARLHNQSLRRGNEALLPLHNSHNRKIFGFPATLGHLAMLEPIVITHLCKAFELKDDAKELYKFCGVSFDTIPMVLEYYPPAEGLALERVLRRQKRNAEIEAAGPPTAQSRRAAENHNRVARAHNGKIKMRRETIMPIHDEHNIPVTGFPKTAGGLFNPDYQETLLFFLTEYKQGSFTYVFGVGTSRHDLLKQWVDFVGVSMDVADSEQIDIYMGTQQYWLM